MKKNLLFAIVIIALAGIIYAINQYGKDHTNIEKLEADFVLTADELFNSFAIDESKANSRFLNKILEVEGIITKINSSEQLNQLFLGTDDPLFGIICDLADGQKIDDWHVGDKIIVRGECSGYLMDVALNRCIIVK